jgi:hypothetical protein
MKRARILRALFIVRSGLSRCLLVKVDGIFVSIKKRFDPLLPAFMCGCTHSFGNQRSDCLNGPHLLGREGNICHILLHLDNNN